MSAYLSFDWYLFHSSERLHVVVCVRAPASHSSSKFKPGSPAQFGTHSSSSAWTAEVPGPPLTFGGRRQRGEATGAQKKGAFRRKARTSETLDRRQFSLCGDEEDAAEAKTAGAASDDEQAIRGVESRDALGMRRRLCRGEGMRQAQSASEKSGLDDFRPRGAMS